MSAKSRRTVYSSGLVPAKGRPRLWAFGYADYARLFGLSVVRIRQMAASKRSGRTKEPFDFGNLESVCREWLRRKAGKL